MVKSLPPAGAFQLTAEEVQFICNLREMDEDARRVMRRTARTFAIDFPRYKKPTLRLVAGGAG